MQTSSEIYKFTDYRIFLKSHGEATLKRNPSWSYTAWARKLSLSGTAALTMVLNGQRHPGPQMTEKLVKYFGFNGQEKEYFLDLIRLQKVRRDPRLSVLLMEKIQVHSQTKRVHLLDLDRFAAISNWYFYAIREMVSLPGFQESPDWIAEKLRFKVTPREIKQAIATLLKVDLLERKEGRLYAKNAIFQTQNDVADEGLKRFHEQMIQNAQTAIRAVPVNERDISGVTFNLKAKDLPKAKELIRRFQKEALEILESSEGDDTYQLNFQLFPLTQKGAHS